MRTRIPTFAILLATILFTIGFIQAETSVIHFDLPEGKIESTHIIAENGDFSVVLRWVPLNGESEVVFTSQGKRFENKHWTLESAYYAKDVLALCRGAASGEMEYWRLKKQNGKWDLVARADLGAGIYVYGIHMPNATAVELTRKSKAVDRLEVTDQPLIGAPLYRVVKMNGQEYWPYGRAAGGPTATGEKVPPSSAPSNEPINHPLPNPNLSTPNTESASSTPWTWMVLLTFLAIGLLAAWFKWRK